MSHCVVCGAETGSVSTGFTMCPACSGQSTKVSSNDPDTLAMQAPESIVSDRQGSSPPDASEREIADRGARRQQGKEEKKRNSAYGWILLGVGFLIVAAVAKESAFGLGNAPEGAIALLVATLCKIAGWILLLIGAVVLFADLGDWLGSSTITRKPIDEEQIRGAGEVLDARRSPATTTAAKQEEQTKSAGEKVGAVANNLFTGMSTGGVTLIFGAVFSAVTFLSKPRPDSSRITGKKLRRRAGFCILGGIGLTVMTFFYAPPGSEPSSIPDPVLLAFSGGLLLAVIGIILYLIGIVVSIWQKLRP